MPPVRASIRHPGFRNPDLFDCPAYALIWNHYAAQHTAGLLPEVDKRAVLAQRDERFAAATNGHDADPRTARLIEGGYCLAMALAGQGIPPTLPRNPRGWFRIEDIRIALSVLEARGTDLVESVVRDFLNWHGLDFWGFWDSATVHWRQQDDARGRADYSPLSAEPVWREDIWFGQTPDSTPCIVLSRLRLKVNPASSNIADSQTEHPTVRESRIVRAFWEAFAKWWNRRHPESDALWLHGGSSEFISIPSDQADLSLSAFPTVIQGEAHLALRVYCGLKGAHPWIFKKMWAQHRDAVQRSVGYPINWEADLLGGLLIVHHSAPLSE
jgi:hypothetical protein